MSHFDPKFVKNDKWRERYGAFSSRFTHPNRARMAQAAPISKASSELKGAPRGPRAGAVNAQTISQVTAVRPTLPGQHTAAQQAYAKGELKGSTYQQVNPYTSTRTSKFGAGGAIVGRKTWMTYLPIEQHKDTKDMKILKREKDLIDRQDKDSITLKQEADTDPSSSRIKVQSHSLGLTGQKRKEPFSASGLTEEAPHIKPAALSRLEYLQQRNASKMEKWGGEMTVGEMEVSRDHKIPDLHKHNKHLCFNAQQIVKKAEVNMLQNQAIRKPVLFNPLAKQVKDKARAHFTDFTPRVVVSSDGRLLPDSMAKVIPPPPEKKPEGEACFQRHGPEKGKPAPPPPKEKNTIIYDLMGNVIENQAGFPTSALTEQDKVNLTGVDLKKEENNQDGEEAENQAGPSKSKKSKKHIRSSGGEIWEDKTLDDWGESDFRIFVGDLGQEVTDELLTKAFSRYVSFRRAKVVIDKVTRKPKGYGFVALGDPDDYIKAMREMQGHYIGARPVKLRKSSWKDRNIFEIKKKNQQRRKWGFKVHENITKETRKHTV